MLSRWMDTYNSKNKRKYVTSIRIASYVHRYTNHKSSLL